MAVRQIHFGHVDEKAFFVAQDEQGGSALFRRSGKYGIRYEVREDTATERIVLERSESSRMKRRIEFGEKDPVAPLS